MVPKINIRHTRVGDLRDGVWRVVLNMLNVRGLCDHQKQILRVLEQRRSAVVLRFCLEKGQKKSVLKNNRGFEEDS